MKKNVIAILALMLTVSVFADEIIVDHASGRNPAVGPIQFVSSGTGTNTVLKVNSVQATNITATAINGATTIAGTTVSATTVTASGKVSSYGYPIQVGHTNGSAQVYLTQSGSVVGAVATSTVTYAVAYIAEPQVVIMPTVGAVVTNGATLTTRETNRCVVTTGEATNFYWIANGRIK